MEKRGVCKGEGSDEEAKAKQAADAQGQHCERKVCGHDPLSKAAEAAAKPPKPTKSDG